MSIAVKLEKMSVSSAEIVVKMADKRSGTIVEITAASNWTVERLKKEYATKRPSDIGGWTCYVFYASSMLMQNVDSLSKHKIANGSMIQALYEEPKVQVQVRGLDGRTVKIDTFASWTVRRLKEEYGRYLGEGWDNVVMLYKAARLKDEQLLSLYKIEKDGFIQANVRSVGGVRGEEY